MLHQQEDSIASIKYLEKTSLESIKVYKTSSIKNYTVTSNANDYRSRYVNILDQRCNGILLLALGREPFEKLDPQILEDIVLKEPEPMPHKIWERIVQESGAPEVPSQYFTLVNSNPQILDRGYSCEQLQRLSNQEIERIIRGEEPETILGSPINPPSVLEQAEKENIRSIEEIRRGGTYRGYSIRSRDYVNRTAIPKGVSCPRCVDFEYNGERGED